MIETAVVLNKQGEAIFWHEPEGRENHAIPNSATLWHVLWMRRDDVGGVAHTHPGTGLPSPSFEDITTFSAVDRGLDTHLVWWIASADRLVRMSFQSDGCLVVSKDLSTPAWLAELRRRSRM